jgi:hypothetical protein
MLPNVSQAIVEPSKVRDYLLSPVHPIGRFKAVVFAALGYAQEEWPRLRDDLLAHASAGEVFAAESGPYGQKYTVSGSLTGPNGRTRRFRSVWLVGDESSPPRFVTAYPE